MQFNSREVRQLRSACFGSCPMNRGKDSVLSALSGWPANHCRLRVTPFLIGALLNQDAPVEALRVVEGIVVNIEARVLGESDDGERLPS